MAKHQKIRCSIESCRFNEFGSDCLLDSIEVCPCPECGRDSVTSCRDSLCASFEVK
ncbi:MAG: DUF1540 domain-containing protein [Clostridiales bacterium]|nr:DUF1540 domain-containing protein [Clostridiales bacterium]MBR2223531.1 DUF1540 domain-containing protein [Christensenellaceae bacterium]MBR3842148.1 DUF1540 domain-containing protein [Christensenellaceae bacterium]